MLGEMAALLTALCWSSGAIFFGLAGQRLGSVAINRLRLLLALLFLLLIHWVLFGTPLPLTAETDRWLWLTLSGVVGLALGDTFLFQAYILIGPRLAMLLKSLAPVFSAWLAWLFLAETLTPGQVGGIFLTIGGIGWVILARDQTGRSSSPRPRKAALSLSLTTLPYLGLDNLRRWLHHTTSVDEETRRYTVGVLCGVGTALCQALGLILAKKGLGGNFSAMSGNLIRMLGGAIILWGVALFQAQSEATMRLLLIERWAGLNITTGTLIGTVFGVWLSLLAVQRANIGIASTLMALVPIFMLPIGYFIFKERFGWPVVAGTLVTMVGVALLFLT